MGSAGIIWSGDVAAYVRHSIWDALQWEDLQAGATRKRPTFAMCGRSTLGRSSGPDSAHSTNNLIRRQKLTIFPESTVEREIGGRAIGPHERQMTEQSSLERTHMTYSRVSSLAVISAICGVGASLELFIPEIAPISLIGLATGIVAWRSIRKYELVGRSTALFGAVVSLLFMAGTPAWHIAWFRSEAPPDYIRLDFASLTKENQRAFESFVGENICLKGYAYQMRTPVNEFVLTSNGANRSLDNMIVVQLPDGESWGWQPDALAVSGRLVVNPAAAADPILPRFILTNSKIRQSCTRFQLASLVTNDGCRRRVARKCVVCAFRPWADADCDFRTT